ncbi:hypothetical protein [Arthrobacter alpinus]|uniref:hypothetical protein n=1 Tax=Arthrobacter alpinus TaxID=656366 RepID=UPI000A78B596|nr:hypothetical protein [Arthrobacter alpinus]
METTFSNRTLAGSERNQRPPGAASGAPMLDPLPATTPTYLMGTLLADFCQRLIR